MTPIAKFHTHGNRTIVDLDLVRDDATVIALSEHGHLLGVPSIRSTWLPPAQMGEPAGDALVCAGHCSRVLIQRR